MINEYLHTVEKQLNAFVLADSRLIKIYYNKKHTCKLNMYILRND